MIDNRRENPFTRTVGCLSAAVNVPGLAAGGNANPYEIIV
jgi:hypothetical protein